MTTKLTLSVKQEVVEKAKRISAKEGKSVSRMVEDFFENFQETSQKSIVEQMDDLMAPYRDRINKSIPKGKSYRDMVRQWRSEDYSNQTKAKTVRKQPKTK